MLLFPNAPLRRYGEFWTEIVNVGENICQTVTGVWWSTLCCYYFSPEKIDLKILQNHPDLHVNIGLRYGWWRALGPWGWCLFIQALGKEINASKVHVCNQTSSHCCVTGKRDVFFEYFHHQLTIYLRFTTLQFMMNVKLIQQRFLPRHKNQLIMTIPTIFYDLCVCLNSGSQNNPSATINGCQLEILTLIYRS